MLLDYEWASYTWTIYSLSSVADSNLNYTSKIIFGDSLWFAGELVDVRIPFSVGNLLFPLDIVKVKSSTNAGIHTYSSGAIVETNIAIWKVYWDQVEVLSDDLEDKVVIVSDVTNYDEAKHSLRVKQ